MSISGQVVTITTSGLSSFSDQTVFRHDLLGTIDATLTVSGYISADNIDPSGITIGNNEAHRNTLIFNRHSDQMLIQNRYYCAHED